MNPMREATEDAFGSRITIVEAQRRTKVSGPDLLKAVVYGEIPSVPGPHGLEMVHLADVEAWAARRP